MSDARCIITFPNTHHALRAERVAGAAGVSTRMIPVPRYLSADCNVGMETSVEDGGELVILLRAKKVECRLVIRQ